MLETFTTYSFTIRGVDAIGEGPESNGISATTFAACKCSISFCIKLENTKIPIIRNTLILHKIESHLQVLDNSLDLAGYLICQSILSFFKFP